MPKRAMLIAFVLSAAVLAAQAEEPPAEMGELITVVTPDNRARLCPVANCDDGAEIARIRTGSQLEVMETEIVTLPLWAVVWYKVSYKTKIGWVSEFDTNKAPAQPRPR